ncbi:hypothetical protein ACFOQM_10600 [Paenibacillus sp. GCM10012307]|uniref:Uncharacterized protein n=1 Tax=Paenibacillus roseus TaxID=2798579 RepID=A0A934J1U3_9BACL|nr:hypothetical protein [Paenibacillus roseus]MBJ6361739.1 hypothetical protein [Paenibacillus roseus]
MADEVMSFFGPVNRKELRALGRAYREYRASIKDRLEDADGLFNNNEVFAWDEDEADGLLALTQDVLLNPGYYLARHWAVRADNNSLEAKGLLDFCEYCLARALALYEAKKSLQNMAFYVYTLSQFVDDLIEARKAASR